MPSESTNRLNVVKVFLILAFIFILVVSQERPLPAQEQSFAQTLYPVLEKAACRSCHNPDGVASATRLQFPEADASPERVEAFGRSLVELIDRKQPEESLLLKKPTNRTPHAGGARIKPGSEEELRGLIASFRDYWIVGPKALAPKPTKSVSDK